MVRFTGPSLSSATVELANIETLDGETAFYLNAIDVLVGQG